MEVFPDSWQSHNGYFDSEALWREMKRIPASIALPLAAGLLAALGMADSAYLALKQWSVLGTGSPLAAGVCSLEAGVCDVVAKSPEAAIAGIPAPLLGTAYFALILGAAAARIGTGRWPLPPVMVTLLVLGMVYSAYLTYSLLFVMGTPCPYCLAAHGANAALFVAFAISLRIDRGGSR